MRCVVRGFCYYAVPFPVNRFNDLHLLFSVACSRSSPVDGADRTELHNNHGPFLRLRLLPRRRRVTKYELKRNVNTNHRSSDIYCNRFYFLFVRLFDNFQKNKLKTIFSNRCSIRTERNKSISFGYRFLIVPREVFSSSVAESE